MALFGLSLKKIKEGIDLGTSLFNVGKSSLENIFGQPQVSAPPPTPQLPIPSVTPPQQQPFNFASTFKQPGAPAQQSFPQPLSLSTFSTKLPTAPSTVLETVKQVAPTMPEPAKPINPFDIVKGFSKAASIAIPATPFGETTQGKIASQGFGELGKGNIPGAAKSLFQTGLETGVQVSPMGQAAKISAPIQAAITKTTPQIEYEKNLDFGRSIVNVGPNMASTIPGSLAGIATGGKAIQEPINRIIYGNEKAQQIKQQQEQIVKDLYKAGGNIQNIGVPKYDKTSIQSQLGDAVGSIGQSLLIGATGPLAVPIFYQQAQGRVSLETYQNTGDINKSAIAGASYGAIEAALEKFSLDMILKPAATTSIKNIILNVIKKMTVEGSTEGLQQIAENITRMLAGDKSIKTWWQGAPEAAIFGAISGGAVAGPIEIANFNFVNNQLKNIQEQSSRLPVSYDYGKLSEALNNKIQFDAQNIQNQLLQINPETQVGPRPATQQERQIEQQQRQIEQQNIAQQQAAPTATSDLLQGYQLPSQRTQTDLQGQIQDITTQFPKVSPEAANRLIQQYDYSTVIGVASEIQKSGTAKNLEAVLTSELQKRFGKSNVQVTPLQVQETAQQAKERLNIPQPTVLQPGEVLSAQQQDLWDSKYSQQIDNIDTQLIQLQNQLATAPRENKIAIQNQINKLNQQSAKLEQQFINESASIPGVQTEPSLTGIQPKDKAQSTNTDFAQQSTETTVKHELQKSLDTIKSDVGALVSDINKQSFTYDEMAQDIQRASRDPKFKPSREVMAYYKNIKNWLDSWADYAGLEGIKTKEFYLPQFREGYVYNYNNVVNDSIFSLDTTDFGFSKKREDKLNLANLDYSPDGLVRYAIQAKAYALRHDIRAEQLMAEQARELEIDNANRETQGLPPITPMTRQQAVQAARSEEELVKTIQDVKTTKRLGKEISNAKTVEEITQPANINPEMSQAEINQMNKKFEDLAILDKFTEQGKNEGKLVVTNNNSPGAVRQPFQDSFGIYSRMKHTSYFSGLPGTMWDTMGFNVYQDAPATATGIRQEANITENLKTKSQQDLVGDFAQFYLNKIAYPERHTAELNNPNTQNVAYQIYRKAADMSAQYNENTLLHPETTSSIINKSADYLIYRISQRIAPINYSDEFVVGKWLDEQNREGFRPDLNATQNRIAELSQAVPNEIMSEASLNKINQIQDIVFANMQRKMGTQVLINELKRTQFTDPTLRKVLTRDAMRMLRQDNFNRSLKDRLTDGVTGVVHTAALGLNFSSAMYNPLETKQIYSLFGAKAYGKALKAATQPGGFDITKKYGVDSTKGANLEGYGDNVKGITSENAAIRKDSLTKTALNKGNNILMYMFNKSEQWKDAVMLHAFEQKGIELGLKQQDLINYVMTNFNKYGIKYGQFGTLGFNKTKTGRIALQFMQYSIKNYAINAEKIGMVTGWGAKQATTQERKAALKYLGRKTIFDLLAWLILGRLMGAGWEQIVGFFNPLSKRAKSEDPFIQLLMYIPTGPIIASMLNVVDSIVAEQIASEDQQRAFEWKKVLSPSVKSNIPLLVPAGVQLFNKTGVQNYIPGVRDWLDQGAIKDIQRGYNVSTTGQARFLAPDNPYEIAKALIFGPYSTSNAKEYFGQTPIMGIIPGDIRTLPVINLFAPGKKFSPIPKKLQELLDQGRYTPAEAISIGRELDDMFKKTFSPQPGDTPSEIKDKENLNGIYSTIEKTTFNPRTGKRESDVLSPEKWKLIGSDASLKLFNFYKDKSLKYSKIYGYSVDPIYELQDPAQIKQVLQIRGTYTGDKIEQEEILRATQQWYRDFEKKNQEYGRQIAANKLDASDEYGPSPRKEAYQNIKPPENTLLMDQYYAIKNKDANAGKEFFKANADQLSADFTNYRKQKLNYINAKRNLEGVPPIPENVFNNVTFGYEDDERKVFLELYYQKGFKDQFGKSGYTRRFNQPSIYRPSRLPSTTAMRTGVGKQIRLRPGRVVVRRNPM